MILHESMALFDNLWIERRWTVSFLPPIVNSADEMCNRSKFGEINAFLVQRIKERMYSISWGNVSFPLPDLQRKTWSRQSQVQQNRTHGWENLLQFLLGTTPTARLCPWALTSFSNINGVLLAVVVSLEILSLPWQADLLAEAEGDRHY